MSFSGNNRVLTLNRRGKGSSKPTATTTTTTTPLVSADVAALTKKRRRTKAEIAAGTTAAASAASKASAVGAVRVAQFRDGAVDGQRFDAFGATKDDAAIVGQINDAVDQHNAANEHKWYNSYNNVPDNDALPAAIGQKKQMDWSVHNESTDSSSFQIEDHWFIPQNMRDLVGNESAINNIVARWIELWTRDPLVLPQRCVMMLRGAPGIGKTTAIKLLLHEYGFNNIVEINASDVRSRKLINERLVPILLGSTCAPLRRTAIVLEEVDGLFAGGGGGGGGGGAKDGGNSNNASNANLPPASSSSSTASGSEALIRFFAGKGFKPRQAAGGLVARCERCVRGPCERCDETLRLYRLQACKSKCGEKKRCCAACRRQAESRQRACSQCARLPCNVCADAPPPIAIDGESYKPFRSPVPIIMLANMDFAPFLKTLEEQSLFVLFKPVPLGAVQTRLKHLCLKFNIRWSEPALLDALATRCGGDMRKGVALLVGAARAAYARKRLLVPARADTIGTTTEQSERESPTLHIRACDCEAFLGRSTADIRDANYTIWSALTYAMRECTSLVAVQTLCADNEFRMLPDWIFENYLHCAALPESALDPTQRAVALGNMRLLARAFSEAEAVRSDIAYLSDRLAQSVYLHLGVALPTMLIRLPKYFGQSDAALAAQIARPPGLSSNRSGAASVQFQKSSLDGENGNAGGTHSRAIKERNYYASTHGLRCQADTDMFFDFNNYISKLTATRSQGAMAFKEENQLVPDHRTVPKAVRTKLSAAEKQALMQRAEHYATAASSSSATTAPAGAVVSAASSSSAVTTTAAAASSAASVTSLAHLAKRARRQTTLNDYAATTTASTTDSCCLNSAADKKSSDDAASSAATEKADDDKDDNSFGKDDDCQGPPVRLSITKMRNERKK